MLKEKDPKERVLPKEIEVLFLAQNKKGEILDVFTIGRQKFSDFLNKNFIPFVEKFYSEEEFSKRNLMTNPAAGKVLTVPLSAIDRFGVVGFLSFSEYFWTDPNFTTELYKIFDAESNLESSQITMCSFIVVS